MPIEKASTEAAYHLEAVVKKHHKRLPDAGVTIGTEFAVKPDGSKAPTAIRHHGRYVPAAAIITRPDVRRWGGPDAILRLDKGTWEQLGRKQQSAILDRYLCHFEVDTNADGSVILDTYGRPKLTYRQPDFELEGFDEVMARHGADVAFEALSVRRAVATFHQLGLAFAAGPLADPEAESEAA